MDSGVSMKINEALPAWALELIGLYESNAASQFIVYGNVNDRLLIPAAGKTTIGTLQDFLLQNLLPRFDVVLSYDLGNGIRVEKGGEIFSQWSYVKENSPLPRNPRPAVEVLTHYFRYCANLARLGRGNIQVGCLIKHADLLIPRMSGAFDYDLSAIATLIRDWANDSLLADHALATFLITENLNDLHPQVANNPRTAHIRLPLPSSEELKAALSAMSSLFPSALAKYADDLDAPAAELVGASLASVETMLKTREHGRQALASSDLSSLKKQLVEKDCNGLIEFIESKRTLDDLHGQAAITSWLRQDIALWRKNDTAALPKGYLFCGPVGTGKTYMVECLAGEAGVPVVKLKNFRDKWVGSSEGNLERIFRLLHAMGRCYVFIDEDDQALGKRDSGSGDSGLSGRLYSMIAEEMGNSRRGAIIWVLASSRPDLIEVDLKRPGRVDVKIPLFPTADPEGSFELLQALCRKRSITVPDEIFPEIRNQMPILLTPGSADALAVRLYRQVKTTSESTEKLLRRCLADYQNPVPMDVMKFQIQLAVSEASDLAFVPAAFRV